VSANADPNLARLEEAAVRLGPLLDETVLVGGCATGLLITDPGAAPIRPTVDVDLVVDLVHYHDFHAFETMLRARGFTQGQRMDEPICRWWHGQLRIDVMPVGGFLGFTNRWYSSAVARCMTAELPSGRRLRHIDAPHFIATKLTAFEQRGAHDPVTSHDAEDIVLVLDGRESIEIELARAEHALQRHVALGIKSLIDDELFMEALEGFFERQVAVERARMVTERMLRLVKAP
jgi:predicted nucleotidyltransferase